MKSFFEAHIWPKRSQLYRLVYLWVRDRSLAEDMLQNLFEKTIGREQELRNHPNLSGWLVRSLKNEMLHYMRQNRKFDSLEGLEDFEVEESAVSEDTNESVREIMNLLGMLPLKQREIFQLREVEGLSYEEIAAHLDISIEQVKVGLFRARKALREKMQKKMSR